MKLKTYIILISLLFSLTFLFAQADSLATLNDSMLFQQAKADSLAIQALLDSLDIAQDTIDYSDYLNLFERVEEYKSSSRDTFQADPGKTLFWSVQGHLFGLSSENYFIRKDHFSELGSPYPTYLKLQNYNRFYTDSWQGNFYTLAKEYYDLPVTAIEVVASTGDYDLGTGYVALKKNKFLDKYNLDFRMNFVKGDFYYGSELASNTSANLIIPFTKSNLDIAFNSIAYEGPYHRLSPAFRINSTIFENNSHSISAFYSNNLLNLGVKYASENYTGIAPKTLEREYLQILFNKEFSSEHWLGQINLEYFVHKEDFYSQEMNSLSSDIDHLLDISLASDYDHFNLSNRAVITLPYQLLTNTEISYNFSENWNIGAFTYLKETLKKENLFNDYSPSEESALVDYPFYLNEKLDTGLSLNFSSLNLNLGLSVSNTNIENELYQSSIKNDYQAVKTQFSGNISHSYDKYGIHLSSLMKFYQDYENYDIHYLPKAVLTNSFELSRDVNHNNYIKAGIAHHFFDAYLAVEDKNEVLYPQASLLDIYLGFQITKQFEIRGYWKNILDNQTITGHRAIPQSITVLISWNFLN